MYFHDVESGQSINDALEEVFGIERDCLDFPGTSDFIGGLYKMPIRYDGNHLTYAYVDSEGKAFFEVYD